MVEQFRSYDLRYKVTLNIDSGFVESLYIMRVYLSYSILHNQIFTFLQVKESKWKIRNNTHTIIMYII